ncbi:MAG: lysophospholipid acyltransferase family protein [Rikenellaceae bacterium]
MTTKSKLSFWQRVAIEIIWFWCRVISITPRWFRYYVLADIIYFFVYKCRRYRVKVVDKNLENSFPTKSAEERAKIRKAYYHYLAEVVVSTISLAGGDTHKTILHSDDNHSIEELKVETEGKSWVALTAHYGLWEYLIFWAQFADQSLIAVYHPLENKVFDQLYRRFRSYKNVVPVPLKETVRFCLEHKDGLNGRNFVVGLIADQNPPRRPNSHWLSFLNQQSIFFDGGEKIALKLNLPVYFIYQRRLGRGKYCLEYKLIYDGVEEVETNEITSRYVKMLEQLIEETPHLWLWSHKRWKHNPNKWKHAKR